MRCQFLVDTYKTEIDGLCFDFVDFRRHLHEATLLCRLLGQARLGRRVISIIISKRLYMKRWFCVIYLDM
jgi:hypothetical protein